MNNTSNSAEFGKEERKTALSVLSVFFFIALFFVLGGFMISSSGEPTEPAPRVSERFYELSSFSDGSYARVNLEKETVEVVKKKSDGSLAPLVLDLKDVSFEEGDSEGQLVEFLNEGDALSLVWFWSREQVSHTYKVKTGEAGIVYQ